MRRNNRVLIIVILLSLVSVSCGLQSITNPSGSATQAVDITAPTETRVEEETRAAVLPTDTATPVPPTATLSPTKAPTATIGPTEDVFLTMIANPIDLSTQVTGTPAQWIPPNDESRPAITAWVNTNCREGPAGYYKIVGALNIGQISYVYGRNKEGGRWYIKNPSGGSPQFCWVWSDTTTVYGSAASIPVISVPLPKRYQVEASLSLDQEGAPACPVTMTIYGHISVSLSGTVSYEIIDDKGTPLKEGSIYFTGAKTNNNDKDSEKIVVVDKIKATRSGYYRMIITYPVRVVSSPVYFDVVCP